MVKKQPSSESFSITRDGCQFRSSHGLPRHMPKEDDHVRKRHSWRRVVCFRTQDISMYVMNAELFIKYIP